MAINARSRRKNALSTTMTINSTLLPQSALATATRAPRENGARMESPQTACLAHTTLTTAQLQLHCAIRPLPDTTRMWQAPQISSLSSALWATTAHYNRARWVRAMRSSGCACRGPSDAHWVPRLPQTAATALQVTIAPSSRTSPCLALAVTIALSSKNSPCLARSALLAPVRNSPM